MSGRPSVFLSYAAADRKIGERLHASLERHGCVVRDLAGDARTAGRGARIEEAVRGSDHFVLLFGRHRDRDLLQEQEWQAALEASWEDPDKKMIPVLLRDAELPSFVRSAAAATGDTLGLHVHGLREVEEAAAVIARTARERAAPQEGDRRAVLGGGRFRSYPPAPGRPGDEKEARRPELRRGRSSPGPGAMPRPGRETTDYDAAGAPPRGHGLGADSDRDRRARDSALSFVVEPATPEESSDRFADLERYADELEP